MGYREISPDTLSGNVFSEIGDEWMLITAVKEDGSVNTMTASWGCMGVLWNKNVAVCFIRPQRYTLEFANEAEKITFSFLKSGYRDALTLCGRKSGRDCDKISQAGLNVRCENGVAFFDEARLTLVCRKLYVGKIEENCFVDMALREKNYPLQDYHRIFVCEIEKVLEAI